MKRIWIPALAVLGLASVPTHAAIIHDNGASNPSNFGANFSEGSRREADDFTISSPDVIRSTQFWGSHWITGALPAVENWTAVVYGDASGFPDGSNIIGTSALTLVSRTDTGFDHNGRAGANILDYVMDFVAPIVLPTAGTYWFSVYLQEVPNTTFAWQESGTDGDGNFRLSSNNGASWIQRSNSLAFNISNTFAGQADPVPAPGALALLGLGLLGLGWRRRTA